MKIGLLVCDHVRTAHLDIAGDYDEMFTRLFDHRDDVELVTYDVVNGGMPGSATECDAWLTTGSRYSVNDDEQWIRDLEAFVREVAEDRVPLVGVCFGHQLIAKALGGSVVKSERGWGVGIGEVEIADGLDWATNTGSYGVANIHQDQVDQLPPDAEILGWNDHCPVSMMSVGSTILGIQGHPEMGPDYVEAVVQMRRGTLIPEDVVEEGLASLVNEPDTTMLADWIIGFLETAMS